MAASRKVAAAENDQGLGEIGILGNKIASIFQNRSNQQSKTFPRLQNLNDYDRQQWWEKKKKGGAIRSFLFTWESAPALLVHSPAPQKSVISICSNSKKEGIFINFEKKPLGVCTILILRGKYKQFKVAL